MNIIEAMARAEAEHDRSVRPMSEWHEWLEEIRESYRQRVRAAIAEAEKLGWVIVPKEPTEAMADAGKDAAGFLASPEGWRAMIASAPKP